MNRKIMKQIDDVERHGLKNIELAHTELEVLQSVTWHDAKNAIKKFTDLLNYLLSDAKTFDKKSFTLCPSRYTRLSAF